MRSGGRHIQYLSLEREHELFAPFTERSAADETLKVQDIQHAHAARTGRNVAASTMSGCSAVMRHDASASQGGSTLQFRRASEICTTALELGH